MAGFNIKQGDTQPTLSTVLTDADGQRINLTGKTVTVRVKAMAAPYIYAEYTATPDPSQTLNPGLATYDWSGGGTAVAGEFWLDWVVGGVIALPTVGSNRMTVWPGITDDGLPSFEPVVTLDDVETTIGRALTATEAARALQLVDELTTTIEGVLHKDVRVKRRSETGFIPPTARFYPNWGPVIMIESLTVDGADVLADYLSDAVTASWLAMRPGAKYACTYVSGMLDRDLGGIKGVIMKGVAAVVLAPPAASAGVLSSYNVEGTSITYGSGVTGAAGNVGRLTVGDVAALMTRRKPIIG